MKCEWFPMHDFTAKCIAKFDRGRGLHSSVIFLLLAFLVGLFVLAQPQAYATPLAVLKSDTTAQSYGDQHLGNFEEDWLAFKQTLETADVAYDILSDDDLKAGATRLASYKVIVLPLLTDLPAEAVYALTEYVKGGGRLLITDSGGMPRQAAEAVLKLAGVNVAKHTSMPEIRKLVLSRKPSPVSTDFAVGTLYANVSVVSGAQVAANWQDANGADLGPAIVSLNNNMFLTWAPGTQGEITSNSYLLSLSMDDMVSGITQQAAHAD